MLNVDLLFVFLCALKFSFMLLLLFEDKMKSVQERNVIVFWILFESFELSSLSLCMPCHIISSVLPFTFKSKKPAHINIFWLGQTGCWPKNSLFIYFSLESDENKQREQYKFILFTWMLLLMLGIYLALNARYISLSLSAWYLSLEYAYYGIRSIHM